MLDLLKEEWKVVCGNVSAGVVTVGLFEKC